MVIRTWNAELVRKEVEKAQVVMYDHHQAKLASHDQYVTQYHCVTGPHTIAGFKLIILSHIWR